MVGICITSEVKRAVNETAEQLIQQYEAYVSGEYVPSPNSKIMEQSRISSVGSRPSSQIELLYENTAILNKFIHTDKIKGQISLISYPHIYNRIKKNGFITPYEVDTFVKDSMIYTHSNFLQNVFTPGSLVDFKVSSKEYVEQGNNDDLTSILELSNDDIAAKLALEEFNYYLGTLFKTDESVSSFCEMVPSIFAKFDRFAHVFNGFKSMIGYVSEKITNFKNKIAGQSFKQLVSVVQNYVQKIFTEQMERLKRFKLSVLTSTKTIRPRIANHFSKLKDDAESFFTEENMVSIKGTVAAQIQYVLDFFKDPDIEEIQYIIYRFCTLLTTLKNLFNMKIEPLKKAVQAFDETNLALQTASNKATAGALRAGAIRFEPQQYDAVKTEQYEYVKSRSHEENGNYNPQLIEITPMDDEGVTAWNNGNGDSRIGFSGRWVSVLGAEGWHGVKPQVRRMIMQVQAAFGKRLIINSGYRPRWYNDQTPNAAKNSLHISGIALDVRWEGFNQNTAHGEFKNICKQVGFTGFSKRGKYNSFIHIDLGNREFN